MNMNLCNSNDLISLKQHRKNSFIDIPMHFCLMKLKPIPYIIYNCMLFNRKLVSPFKKISEL